MACITKAVLVRVWYHPTLLPLLLSPTRLCDKLSELCEIFLQETSSFSGWHQASPFSFAQLEILRKVSRIPLFQ